MDLLKKIWPLSFKNNDSVANLVIGVIIYVVVGAVAGALIGLLASIPVLGIIFSLLGSLIGVYTTAGIVLKFLAYFNVLK